LVTLFERLKTEEDVERAKLISEEIWALWMDSGSPSVNYLLTRASEARRKGRDAQARRLIDRMTGLEPDYAEAYARSARLALDEEDYGRAITDATEALIREPRHFYALWTLGNTLERLGKKEQALAVYEEANKLFPKLGGVKERLDALRSEVLGDVL
jgi:tetratricopeptide (TPR) repeat protein